MSFQDEKQGKMLLHTEHSLLSLLSGMEGVVQKHDFFTEMCLMVKLLLKLKKSEKVDFWEFSIFFFQNKKVFANVWSKFFAEIRQQVVE